MPIPRDNSLDPTPYALKCLEGACGSVFVAADVIRAHAQGSPWRCPRCFGTAALDPECRYAVRSSAAEPFDHIRGRFNRAV